MAILGTIPHTRSPRHNQRHMHKGIFPKRKYMENIKDALVKLSNYLDFGYKRIYVHIIYGTKRFVHGKTEIIF